MVDIDDIELFMESEDNPDFLVEVDENKKAVEKPTASTKKEDKKDVTPKEDKDDKSKEAKANNSNSSGNNGNNDNMEQPVGPIPKQVDSLAQTGGIPDENEKVILSNKYYLMKKSFKMVGIIKDMLKRTDLTGAKLTIENQERKLTDWVYLLNKDTIKDFDKWFEQSFKVELNKVLNKIPKNIKQKIT